MLLIIRKEIVEDMGGEVRLSPTRKRREAGEAVR
jgi:hypothetical protein